MTTAAELLARARVVLLDFDGPVCSVYAGYPAAEVARRVRAELDLRGDPTETDPLVVLREAASDSSREQAQRADAVLQAAELDAVDTAAPTAGAADFLSACDSAGVPVAIVSNNSTAAIRRYLDRHELADRIGAVIGRPAGRPDLMKPSPHLIREALSALSAEPGDAVLIGDSTTDVEAAHAAGVPAVGYANKPGKTDRLAAARATALIEDMSSLAHAVARRVAL